VNRTNDVAALDASDPLAGFRARFSFPDPDLTYLDGNSLGRMPTVSARRAREIVDDEWGDRLIRSWNEGWWDAPVRIGDAVAPLIGAREGEVAIADATSVNLYKLVVAALVARPGRTRIVTDDLNFPSDVYILDGAARTLDRGHRVDVVPSPDGIHGPLDAIVDGMADDVALLTLSHVTFKSGYRYDVTAVTEAAHAAGALVLWDLSHSAGSVPVDMSAADLAVGCTYKYLNGGPGSPAFLYVRRDLQERLVNPISGWWAHEAPFTFDYGFRAAAGIRRFLTGTAPVASMSLIEPGVALIAEAGIDALFAKATAQTTYLVDRWEADLAPLGFTLNSPTDPDVRGSHVSLGHPDALGIDLALIHDYAVLPDYRPPDNLRLGIAPIYTRFADVARGVDALAEIVVERRHVPYLDRRPTVT
jgi:kynureninase